MENLAVAYVRYSDHKQDDGFSVEYQMTEIQQHLIKLGLEFEKAYIDTAVSGRKVAGREGFFRLIHDVKAGYVKNIVVYKFNRMFRNSYESHKYRKLFKKHGVNLISVTQQIDDDTSSGRLMINVMSDIDQYQSETISDHVKSGMREMARQGYFTGGTVPFGYKTVLEKGNEKPRKIYEIEEEEAEKVREIFSLYSEGFSLRYLQEFLTACGCFTRQGKQFGITTIARMLRNDFYIGTLRYKTTGYDPIVVENAVPVIIDNETWQAVQERHEQNKLLKPRKRKDLYALTGKIHCKMCGAHFFGCASGSVQRGKKYYYKYYTCANRKNYKSCNCNKIRKDEIESFVLSEIRKNILNEKSIDSLSIDIATLCNQTPDEIESTLKDLRKRKADIEGKLETLIDLRLSGAMSNDILAKKSIALEKDLSTILLEINRMEVKKRNAVTPNSVREYLTKFFDGLENPDDYAMKNLFDNFVERITIDNGEIALTLRVSPFAPFEDKQASGQPHISLSTKRNR